jgi:hypothetical protein
MRALRGHDRVPRPPRSESVLTAALIALGFVMLEALLPPTKLRKRPPTNPGDQTS